MANGIILAILVIIIFLAVRYIVKEKANGRRCIGCPSSGSCSKACSSAGNTVCNGACKCDDK